MELSPTTWNERSRAGVADDHDGLAVALVDDPVANVGCLLAAFGDQPTGGQHPPTLELVLHRVGVWIAPHHARAVIGNVPNPGDPSDSGRADDERFDARRRIESARVIDAAGPCNPPSRPAWTNPLARLGRCAPMPQLRDARW